ncbi:hypothetical protein CTAYLR_002818 [Chrysophaeum taylorii]|uniref:C2 domain-containing protein n=1 Tax=Chrysophaeum taylorii TaxID=2483200 RepID=A0AAD7U871_9STRA|nr:hypothetical protein CTAYLR_002818 [Chrysophaeum taylorii]
MRILKVTVVEAENVVQCETTGTDSYAEIKFIDLVGREIKKESAKTSVISNTLSPVWNEEFEFGEHYDLSHADHLPKMKVRVWDWNRIQKHTCIGVVTMELEAVDESGRESDAWYPLQKDKIATKASGRIRLKMRFLTDDESGYVTKPSYDPFPFEGVEGYEDPSQPQNELWVRVVQARSLRVMDSRSILAGSGGSSDPYAYVSVTGCEARRTSVRKKTLEPIWNEQFAFAVTDPEAFLDVWVYDEDQFSSDFMGKFSLPLSRFEERKRLRQWFKLLDKKGEAAAGG